MKPRRADDKWGCMTSDENRPLAIGRIDVAIEVGKYG
jgi:hypothetical protein